MPLHRGPQHPSYATGYNRLIAPQRGRIITADIPLLSVSNVCGMQWCALRRGGFAMGRDDPVTTTSRAHALSSSVGGRWAGVAHSWVGDHRLPDEVRPRPSCRLDRVRRRHRSSRASATWPAQNSLSSAAPRRSVSHSWSQSITIYYRQFLFNQPTCVC